MRSRGAPWRLTRFPRVVSSHPPRGGARPPPPPPPVLWRWCHMAAPRRCPSPSVRPSASVRSPSAAPRGPRPGVSRFPGPAAAPIRCPLCRRRRLSADVVAGWARGSARDPPHPPTSPPPRRAPRSDALSRARVGSPVCLPRAGRRVLTAWRPPPLWGGRYGRAPEGASAGPGVARPGVPGPAPGAAGAGGLATGGWGCGGGGGPAAPLPSFLHAVAAGAARCVPRGPRVVCAIGHPRRGCGAGGSGGRLPDHTPFSPLPRLAGSSGLARCHSSPASRATTTPPAPGTPGSSCSLPYLVDPASSICLSQRLSHACLSTHGRYSETANGSLNQLWFLWSLAPLLLG